MAGADPDDCCRGAHAASQRGEFTQATVWDACRTGIRDAIESQLDDEQASPVIIDGLPTIGKTQHATDMRSTSTSRLPSSPTGTKPGTNTSISQPSIRKQ